MSTVDPSEVGKFSAIARDWWDPEGAFKPLHAINPCRLDYIVRQASAEFGRDRTARRPFDGLNVVDVGCGGGLLCEPLTRLGAHVTGIDADETAIRVAGAHAAEQGLDISYRAMTAEALAEEGTSADMVLALELIEHVADPAALLRACHDLCRPGGLVILSTLNRTAMSFGLAIVGAEWILNWLPRGTHDWNRFVTPEELIGLCRNARLEVLDRCGMRLDPLDAVWRLADRDLSVNYLMTARRPG